MLIFCGGHFGRLATIEAVFKLKRNLWVLKLTGCFIVHDLLYVKRSRDFDFSVHDPFNYWIPFSTTNVLQRKCLNLVWLWQTGYFKKGSAFLYASTQLPVSIGNVSTQERKLSFSNHFLVSLTINNTSWTFQNAFSTTNFLWGNSTFAPTRRPSFYWQKMMCPIS